MRKINGLLIGILFGLLSLFPLVAQARGKQLVNETNPYPGLAYFDDRETHMLTVPCLHISTRDQEGNPVQIADVSGVNVYKAVFKQDSSNPGLFDLMTLAPTDPAGCYPRASKMMTVFSAWMDDQSLLVYLSTASEKESYFAAGFDILATPEVRLRLTSLDVIDRTLLANYASLISTALGEPYPPFLLCHNALLNMRMTSYFPGRDMWYDEYACGMTLFTGNQQKETTTIPVTALSKYRPPALTEHTSEGFVHTPFEALTNWSGIGDVFDPNEDLWWGRDSSGREWVLGNEAWMVMRNDANNYFLTHNVSSDDVDVLYQAMLVTGAINPFGAGRYGTYEPVSYQLIAEVGDNLIMKNKKNVSGEHAINAKLMVETEFPIRGKLSFILSAMPDGSTRDIEIPLKARNAGPGIFQDTYQLGAGEYKNNKLVDCSENCFGGGGETGYSYSARTMFFGLNAKYAVVSIGLGLRYKVGDDWHYPSATGTLIFERITPLWPYFR